MVHDCNEFVMLFAYKDDADRELAMRGKRLGNYGLQPHPDKTSLVDFRFRDFHHMTVDPQRWPSTSSGLPMPGCACGKATQWRDGRRRKLGWRVRSKQFICSAGPCDIDYCGSSTNALVRCSTGTMPTLASPATLSASRTCMRKLGEAGASGCRESRTIAR